MQALSDTTKAWTDPAGFAEDAKNRGRGFLDWFVLLVLTFGLFLADTVVSFYTGVTAAIDGILQNETGGITYELGYGLATFFVLGAAGLVLYFILPRLSRWYGAQDNSRGLGGLMLYSHCALSVLLSMAMLVFYGVVWALSVPATISGNLTFVVLSLVPLVLIHGASRVARPLYDLPKFKNAVWFVVAQVILLVIVCVLIALLVLFATEFWHEFNTSDPT